MFTPQKSTLLCLALLIPLFLSAQRDDGFSSFANIPRKVKVNRWVSPVVGDFVSIPENHATDEQLRSWGYKDKIFQYETMLDNPEDESSVAVYRWTMPNCREFILLAEHEHTDAQLESWGYTDKKLMFYAWKTKLNSSYVPVSRWVNALPQGNMCRDYTLSVTATELSDAQLTSWGYSGKKVQFYVYKP